MPPSHRKEKEPVHTQTGFALPALAVLDLSLNALRELPANLGAALPALRQLYVASNKLGALPESLAKVWLCECVPACDCTCFSSNLGPPG